MKNIRWPQRSQLLHLNSKEGKMGYSLPKRQKSFSRLRKKREKLAELPQLSELDVVRHYTRLSHQNYSIDEGFYPLGSCTMKYNPRINEFTAGRQGFLLAHPLCPEEFVQGNLRLMAQLEKYLQEISGFTKVSLQPAAGAQGEYAGIKMIRHHLIERDGVARSKLLIPESAHGTNCATAAMCGYQVTPLKVKDNGIIDPEDVKRLMEDPEVAGLMVTNPNTAGLFESHIQQITEIIHSKGGLVYCDGANLNAMLGVTRPGDAGIDVMHFNQHKTFTTPHGGGGPGCGAVGVSETLIPYLPSPVIAEVNNSYKWDYDRPLSIGPIKDFYGHFLMMVRSHTYISELGREGLSKIGRHAILLANYIRARLTGHFHLSYDRACMHEVVFDDQFQLKNDISTLDIAKKIIDYGYHPPTIYFPLIIKGALMIEPTETESLETIDEFCEALIEIANLAKEDNAKEKHFENCPRGTPFAKVDETEAARNLRLSWRDL